jgi:hypothetical protein
MECDIEMTAARVNAVLEALNTLNLTNEEAIGTSLLLIDQITQESSKELKLMLFDMLANHYRNKVDALEPQDADLEAGAVPSV